MKTISIVTLVSLMAAAAFAGTAVPAVGRGSAGAAIVFGGLHTTHVTLGGKTYELGSELNRKATKNPAELAAHKAEVAKKAAELGRITVELKKHKEMQELLRLFPDFFDISNIEVAKALQGSAELRQYASKLATSVKAQPEVLRAGGVPDALATEFVKAATARASVSRVALENPVELAPLIGQYSKADLQILKETGETGKVLINAISLMYYQYRAYKRNGVATNEVTQEAVEMKLAEVHMVRNRMQAFNKNNDAQVSSIEKAIAIDPVTADAIKARAKELAPQLDGKLCVLKAQRT